MTRAIEQCLRQSRNEREFHSPSRCSGCPNVSQGTHAPMYLRPPTPPNPTPPSPPSQPPPTAEKSPPTSRPSRNQSSIIIIITSITATKPSTSTSTTTTTTTHNTKLPPPPPKPQNVPLRPRRPPTHLGRKDLGRRERAQGDCRDAHAVSCPAPPRPPFPPSAESLR